MPLDFSSTPLISVVIPTFNASSFLPDAIESIRRQAYEPLEIIVVDDGSTDDTPAVVSRWPEVRYLRQQNQGPSGARNTGIRAATSDLLAFLDVDDLWTRDHLQRLLPPMLADESLRFAWGASRFVRMTRDASGRRSHLVTRDNVPLFLVGAGLYRRSVFTEVGMFDPQMRIGEDTDWFAATRLAKTPQLQVHDNVLIYREREGSLTTGRKTFQGLNTMAVLQRAIQRHRASQAESRPAA